MVTIDKFKEYNEFWIIVENQLRNTEITTIDSFRSSWFILRQTLKFSSIHSRRKDDIICCWFVVDTSSLGIFGS